MPLFFISGLAWMCVLGNFPPFTKKILTPNSITASAIRPTVNNKVAIVALKFNANIKIVCDFLCLISKLFCNFTSDKAWI